MTIYASSHSFLTEPSPQHKNNFDFIRLFAALLVLASHAYPLYGLTEPWVWALTSLGGLGVYLFFTVSGYLITQSWVNDPHQQRFWLRRILRIFPALIVATLIAILIIGPIFTTLPLQKYFVNAGTFQYLRNIILNIWYQLPGVFETNPLANIVNGSLWTLPIELAMYAILSLVAIFSRTISLRFSVLAITSMMMTLDWLVWNQLKTPISIYATDIRFLPHFGAYFFLGSSLFLWKHKISFSLSGSTLAFIALIIAIQTPWVKPVAWLTIPYITIAFGVSSHAWLSQISRFGDFSYGLYIYAFPIQQILTSFLYPTSSFMLYLFLSIGLTLSTAVLSWFFIEKPALSLKPPSVQS